MVLAPKDQASSKGEHREVFEDATQGGFRPGAGQWRRSMLSWTRWATLGLDKQKWHYIEIVVDRLVVRSDDLSQLSRVSDSNRWRQALRQGEGVVHGVGAKTSDGAGLFSEQFACVRVRHQPA